MQRGWSGASSDGNVYVVRWANPVIVYGISPAGEIVHRYEIPADPGLKPVVIQLRKTKIAVLLRQENQRVGQIKILDVTSGEIVATYDANLGSALTCYTTDPDQFVFLANTKEGMQLIFAQP